MNEKWKDVIGYEGLYQVSNMGRIRNSKGKIRKTFISEFGYERITLTKNRKQEKFQVHRLVAQAFIRLENDNEQVNHIDGDKLNNKVNNLEWCSASENVQHAFKIGLHKAYTGYREMPNEKMVKKLTKDGKVICKYRTAGEAGRENNIESTNIRAVCRGKRKTAGGYKWEYVEGRNDICG